MKKTIISKLQIHFWTLLIWYLLLFNITILKNVKAEKAVKFLKIKCPLKPNLALKYYFQKH